MDCSPPGSSVHEILQARILEWVAIPFSRGSSQPRDQTWVSCIVGRFITIWATREAFKSFLENVLNSHSESVSVHASEHQWKEYINYGYSSQGTYRHLYILLVYFISLVRVILSYQDGDLRSNLWFRSFLGWKHGKWSCVVHGLWELPDLPFSFPSFLSLCPPIFPFSIPFPNIFWAATKYHFLFWTLRL